MKVLILGVTGMLGHTVFLRLAQESSFDVWGTLRSASELKHFSNDSEKKLFINVDVLDNDSLINVMTAVKPDVVINCIGLIKQLSNANDPLSVLPINAIFPHKLANLCALANMRMIHISTDCVFNGRKGMYVEEDVSDAEDLYGKSKYIGELQDLSHVVTLRTSIIGHELNSHSSLVDWFLSKNEDIKGYTKAIFSGLPTVELADVIKNVVITNKNLYGLYHVSADPIDKYSLLNLIADIYGKEIKIEPNGEVKIDRSLDSSKFRQVTGYEPPNWSRLIEIMHQGTN